MLGIRWTLDKCEFILFFGLASWFLSGALSLFIPSATVIFFTLWIGSSAIYLAVSTVQIQPEGKAVLITGCDSGFGYSLALHLDTLGFRVFAACLMANDRGDGAESLRKIGSKTLHVIQMDVTSDDSANKARAQIEELLSENEHLWALVNNAGIGTFGEVAWVPMETFSAAIDVNVMGVIRVTKAFLPLIKKSKGRIVNVSSMMGRMSVPMRAPYVLSKFAIEGFSDCLRHEMKSWGVDVLLVEPGNFIAGTNIFTEKKVDEQANTMWKSMPEEIKNICGVEYFRSKVEVMKSYVTQGNTDLSPVIDAFTEAITQVHPQARYQPMELYYKIRILVYTHLPEWVYDNFYIGNLNK